MLFSLVECQWKATSLRIAACSARREKRKKRSGGYLRRRLEKAAAGATAFSQYSTTAPTTRWWQVPWTPKLCRHIVVEWKAGVVEGSQRKLRVERRAGTAAMHVTEHPAGNAMFKWVNSL